MRMSDMQSEHDQDFIRAKTYSRGTWNSLWNSKLSFRLSVFGLNQPNTAYECVNFRGVGRHPKEPLC